MALTVTHAKINTVPDNPSDVDTGGVLASDWNAAHTVAGSIDATDLPSTVVNSVSNDSNVTGTIATQTLTLGWSGTLPIARGGLNTSTAPSAAQIPIAGGSTTYTPKTISGEGALSSTGGLTVTKTNGVAFAASATTDATNASNISSGTLAVGCGGLNTSTAPTLAQVPIAAGTTTYTPKTIGGDATLTSTGALTVTKTNGSAFAASATVDATNATNISSGTLSASRLSLTGPALINSSGAVTYVASTPVGVTGANTSIVGTTAFKMFGLAFSVTPARSGTFLVLGSFRAVGSAISAGSGDDYAIYYGTGTAPSVGTSATGTDAFFISCSTPNGATNFYPMLGSITGLTKGTAYWIDMAGLLGSSTTTMQIFSPAFTFVEL